MINPHIITLIRLNGIFAGYAVVNVDFCGRIRRKYGWPQSDENRNEVKDVWV